MRWLDWFALAPSERFVKYRLNVVVVVAAGGAAVAVIVAHESVANCAVRLLDHYSIAVSANSDLRPNHD